MIDLILKKVTALKKIERYNSFLFIGPHPDDIEVACGATVKKLTDGGKKVSFVVATDGRVGSVKPELMGEELVQIRQKEAVAAAAMLGVTDVTFLPFYDGGGYTELEMRRALAKEIVRSKPDVVFCPDFKVKTECHPDHILVGQAATYALCGYAPWKALMEQEGITDTHAAAMIAYYYTAKPNAYIRINKTFDAQSRALEVFTSQFTPNDLKILKLYRTLRAVKFGIRSFKGKCDGFRTLPSTRMHCVPEGEFM